MMIRGIIFDLDGTLLNTIEDIYSVLNESLVRYRLPKITIKQAMQYVGNGARKLVERAVGDCPSEIFEKVYLTYAKNFAACGNERTVLFDGEEEVLLSLKKKGLKMAIVTNKPQRATENVVAKYLSKFDFCEVLGQTEYFALKPNPDATLAIIDKLAIKKEECIFVGDGETDVLTAKSAGIRCVSALWGYRTREQLESAGAAEFAENFQELLRIVNG